jgi:hypothetical protein
MTTTADQEDREYFAVDLGLPLHERCGAVNARLGRTCSRRALHVSDTHRDGELSWTQDNADETSTEVLQARLARFEAILANHPDNDHATIMVLAISAELAARVPLDVRCLTHEIRRCTICTPAGVA